MIIGPAALIALIALLVLLGFLPGSQIVWIIVLILALVAAFAGAGAVPSWPWRRVN